MSTLLLSNQRQADEGAIYNSSIGGPAGWTEYVVGVLASKIVDAGRIVTIAAGNEGADGAWYASGPATGLNVISVSSVEK